MKKFLHIALFIVSSILAALAGWVMGYEARQHDYGSIPSLFIYLLLAPLIVGLWLPHPFVPSLLMNLMMVACFITAGYKTPIFTIHDTDNIKTIYEFGICITLSAMIFSISSILTSGLGIKFLRYYFKGWRW